MNFYAPNIYNKNMCIIVNNIVYECILILAYEYCIIMDSR